MNNFKEFTAIISRAILFAIEAWIVTHVFAIFGVFISASYPIIWFIKPDSTICLSCRYRKKGVCHFCGEDKSRKVGDAPSNIRSAFLNGLLLFSLTIILTLVVFGEYKLMSALLPSDDTAFFTISEKGQYYIDDNIPFTIQVDGIETAINAVQADIAFDANILKAVDVSTEESFATVFIQRDVDNDFGYIRLSGGLPNPGFTEVGGKFATVYFTPKKPGIASIKFLPSSMVLANDGNGTNVLRDFAEASYLIRNEKRPVEFPLESPESTKIESNDESPLLLSYGTQLTYFEEGQILGASTSAESEVVDGAPQEEPFSMRNVILELLDLIRDFDEFIFNTWRNILTKTSEKSMA